MGSLDEGGKNALSLSIPQACVGNPCDPSCMYFNEDPPDLTPSGTGGGGSVPPDSVDDYDWSGTGTADCAHALCDVGVALDRSCHPCVTAVCDGSNGQPSCCDGSSADSWSDTCVDLVYTECAQLSPPARPALLCDYAILAGGEAYIVSDGVLNGHILAETAITLNDGAQAGNLISNGPIFTGTASVVGSLYSSYTGGTFLNPADRVGVVVGQGATVNGGISSAGGVEIWGQTEVNGDVRADGSIVVTAGSGTYNGDFFSGGDFTVNGAASTFNGEIHAPGSILLQSSAHQIFGNVYAGMNLSLGGAGPKINADAHVGGFTTLAGGSSYIRDDLFAGGGTDLSGGTVGGSVILPGTTPPTSPQPPTVPPFPTTPSFDDLRRDTSAGCALAAAAADNTSYGGTYNAYPGAHGRIAKGNGTIVIREGGTYYFEEIDVGWNGRIRFDGVGPWDITVCNRLKINSNRQTFSHVDGDTLNGEDILFYVPAVSTGAAFSSLCVDLSSVNYIGMFLAPDCDIWAGHQANSTGAMLWGRNVGTNDGVQLDTIPSEACNQRVNQACGKIREFQPATLSDLFPHTTGDLVHYGGKQYRCTNTLLCNTLGTIGSNAYWPGIGLLWNLSWSEIGDCSEFTSPGAPLTSCPVSLELEQTNPPRNDADGCFDGLDCQINSTCQEVATKAACGHSKCTTGPPLADSCDPCVARICQADASCCSSSGLWDAACVSLVESVCDSTCGASTGPSTVDESAACVENPDSHSQICKDPSGNPAVDLTLRLPCDNSIPVCNHGEKDLAPGNAEIVFFDADWYQFGNESPAMVFSDHACSIDVAVPRQSCVDVACPAVTNNMTAYVSMKSTSLEVECSTLDNWSYFPENRSCTGGGIPAPLQEVQIYEAVCPNDAVPSWGYLTWDADIPGSSTIAFSVRAAHTDSSGSYSFSGDPIPLGTATTTNEWCSFGLPGCPIDLTAVLFSSPHNQPSVMELTIELTPDGSDLATLRDWLVTYSCLVDQ